MLYIYIYICVINLCIGYHHLVGVMDMCNVIHVPVRQFIEDVAWDQFSLRYYMPITPARSFNTCTCYTIMQLPNTIYMYIIHTVITFTLSEYKLYTVCISFLIYYLLYEFIFFLNVQNTIQIRLFMYSKITCLIIIIICLSSCHSLPIYQELWIPRFKEESSIFPVNPNSTRVLFFCVLQILGSLL